MPLDERIRQLSETIIQEVRSPIEAALHNLLGDVMRVAAEDRDQAVQSAVEAAAAGHEASLASLREQLEHHRTDVEGLRGQFDRELEASLAELRETLEREHDEKLAGLRSELTREHETATSALREQLEQERDAALASLREQLEQERESAVAALRAELEQERDAAVARLREELAREHETAIQDIREELGRTHETELGAARSAAEVAGEAALTAALAHSEHQQHEAESRVIALQQELDQARADTTQAQQAVERAENARHEAEQARHEAEQERQQAQQERHEAEQKQLAAEQNLELTHVADRQLDLACSDRTLAGFRRLDEARSLTEVLRVLADQAAGEIGRVAVLLVIGSRLRGWELRGLPGADASEIDVPVDPANVFGLAIATGLPASTSDAPIGLDGDRLTTLLAAPPERAGLAVPISVGGRVVAILYADDAGSTAPVVPSNWPEIAEILARHAGHCLEVLTVSHASILAERVQREQTSPAIRQSDASPFADQRREEESARRYARLLISEIKLYNEAAVEQGRSERNLVGRLGPEIERARRLYEEKIPAAVRQRVDCFDQEVVRTLAGGDPGSLGQT